MTPPAEEPTTVISLPLLKTPKEAKAFAKKNFGHVVLHCFTVQANPTFSGSVGTGKYIFVIGDDEFPEAGKLDKELVVESVDKHNGPFLLKNYQIGKLLNFQLAAITLLDLDY